MHLTEEAIPYRPKESADAAIKERCAVDIHYPEGARDLPVIVWFHGGGLTEGTRYIPAELKSQGVIVVSPGYRLSPGAKSPTYVEDAAAAVSWVFDNIEKYGGSKKKSTWAVLRRAVISRRSSGSTKNIWPRTASTRTTSPGSFP